MVNRKKKIISAVEMAAVSVIMIVAVQAGYSAANPVIAAPTATQENGVITADEWEETYPEIVASYHANSDKKYRID